MKRQSKRLALKVETVRTIELRNVRGGVEDATATCWVTAPWTIPSPLR